MMLGLMTKTNRWIRALLIFIVLYAFLSVTGFIQFFHLKKTALLESENREPMLRSPEDPDVSLVIRLFNLTNTGVNGTPVEIDVSRLPSAEAKKFNRSLYLRDVSSYVSSLVPLQRPLPDIQQKSCKQIYQNLSLPSVSVIIIFHNEHWSTLLRTVHSVLDNSPAHLVKEVLLVDDFSSDEVLKEPLDGYVSRKFVNVRIIRASRRQGLIRARNLGFRKSSAPVVVFLDSHCECFPGWLEPLVARIAENDKIVATPNIHPIDRNNFIFHFWPMNETLNVPVLTFPRLFFKWLPVPPRELKRRHSLTDPIRAPAMVGCVIAISRTWFLKLGMFDPGLELWGGENTELSLKTWLCGGSLELLPCSNVAHLYHPHIRTKRMDHFDENIARVARIWISDRKMLSKVPGAHKVNHIDIRQRLALKRELKCRTFNYYIRHVFPEIYIRSDGIFTGQIQSVLDRSLCFTANMSHDEGSNIRVPFLMPCYKRNNFQRWDFTELGEIRMDGECLDTGQDWILSQTSCHGQGSNQMWKVDIFGSTEIVKIYHGNVCVTADISKRSVSLAICGPGENQLWIWKKNREPRVPASSVDLL